MKSAPMFFRPASLALMGALACGVATATPIVQGTQSTMWANSAGNDIALIDMNTGATLKDFTPGLGNGRGIVQVGSVLYVTTADSNRVTMLDASTGANLGTAFSVAGASGLATMAWDGTNFWIGDYSGTNHAYEYSQTGTLLKTVTLQDCSSYCDGLEYFDGKLISNRFDGGYGGTNHYDVYDLNGNLLQAGFITTQGNGTGIAFDGVNFWVSDIFNNRFTEYDGTTGAYLGALAMTGSSHPYVEDLSFNYANRSDTGGGSVPEPSTFSLFAAAMAAAAFLLRRRRSSKTAA